MQKVPLARVSVLIKRRTHLSAPKPHLYEGFLDVERRRGLSRGGTHQRRVQMSEKRRRKALADLSQCRHHHRTDQIDRKSVLHELR